MIHPIMLDWLIPLCLNTFTGMCTIVVRHGKFKSHTHTHATSITIIITQLQSTIAATAIVSTRFGNDSIQMEPESICLRVQTNKSNGEFVQSEQEQKKNHPVHTNPNTLMYLYKFIQTRKHTSTHAAGH